MSSEVGGFEEALHAALGPLSLSAGADAVRRMNRHFEAMVEGNRAFNLTRITDPEQAAVKHYADSLAALAWVTQRRVHIETLLDLGTGAGFPAVPLAIMRPDWAITAIDATRKKVDFVRRVAAELGLSNLTLVHAHSTHYRCESIFDLVVARAVAPLDTLLASAVGRLAPGGYFLAYKTAILDPAEQKAADACLAAMPLRGEDRFAYELSVADERLRRALYVYSRMG